MPGPFAFTADSDSIKTLLCSEGVDMIKYVNIHSNSQVRVMNSFLRPMGSGLMFVTRTLRSPACLLERNTTKGFR